MKKFTIRCVSLFMLATVPLLFFSCPDQSSNPIENQPPKTPPLATMVMNYDDFTPAFLAKADGRGNWLWAAGNVAFWNTALTVTMAVPVAAFAESFRHAPIIRSDGTWVWAYNFNIAALQYSAELHAKVSLNGIKWDMYISLLGVFENFHWFTGTSDYLVTAGYWQMNLLPRNPVPFMHINWTRDPETQAIDLTYTNILPDGDENGSYIHQAFNQEPPYTGMFEIYRVTEENRVEIKWNRDSLEGRVKDPKHFSNEMWHCWDANLNDTECE